MRAPVRPEISQAAARAWEEPVGPRGQAGDWAQSALFFCWDRLCFRR